MPVPSSLGPSILPSIHSPAWQQSTLTPIYPSIHPAGTFLPSSHPEGQPGGNWLRIFKRRKLTLPRAGRNSHASPAAPTGCLGGISGRGESIWKGDLVIPRILNFPISEGGGNIVANVFFSLRKEDGEVLFDGVGSWGESYVVDGVPRIPELRNSCTQYILPSLAMLQYMIVVPSTLSNNFSITSGL